MPQIVYETNVDYEKTYDSLSINPLVKTEKTGKGHIWFMLRNTKTVFQISSKGKMQVKWNDLDEKKVLLNLVENLLVPEVGQKLIIKPMKQQVWIPYPCPEDFKLYWCAESTKYNLHIGLAGWLDKRDARKAQEKTKKLEAEERACKENLAGIDALMEECVLDRHDPDYLQKVFEIEDKHRKRYGLD